MKVTVCFGNIRVVVPCGLGDILVRDLIREATLRYKKATGKGPDSWVAVHNLQSQGGGILDPDDRLNDVADDREQILASFEDGDGIHHHGGGDGASGSSVGTGSPDIFHDGDHKYSSYPRTDIEVTGEQIASGVPNSLQVRRGSEPTLNQLPVGPPTPQDPTKRWSAAPLILEPPNISGYDININDSWNDSKEEEEYGLKRITRDGNRLSMQFFEDGAGYKWQDAAEKAKSKIHTSTSLPREAKRKEPLGQANSAGSPSPPSDLSELVVIRNEPGPLGIHVVPDYDRLGHNKGLLVQNIEPGGRIDRDGRLAIFDRIIEINGQHLINMPFQRVQEIFKLSLTSPELRMKVVKSNGLEHSRKHISKSSDVKEIMSMVEGEQKHLGSAKVATVSPTKKLPAVSKNLKTLLSANVRTIGKKFKIELLKGRNGLGFSITTRDNPAGGNCPIYIKNIFPKGAAEEDGRLQIGDRLLIVNDVEITGKTQEEAAAVLRNAPPEVTLIVSRQVASEEIAEKENNPDLPNLPRLIDDAPLVKSTEATTNGDNPPNIPPLPQSHLQALQNNRSPDKGSVAKIISQFQDANISSPPDKVEDSTIFPWKHREILTFNIKVHYSEKAGLGIMVKGKINGNQDSGIFIKNVINGGAASRDRRLRTNDQLLNVNGISLLRQSNRDAMDTLENAMMYTKGPVPEHITLMIARRASSPSANRRFAKRSNPNLLNTSGGAELSSNESDPSGNNHSGTSDGSTNTVIYNPYCVEPPQQRHGLSPIQTWNPVIDRLTGNNDSNSNKQLRNESYYKATHDTWTNSMMANNSFGNVTTTTLNMGNNNEPILIEDEYGSRVLNHQNSRINIHMSNKMNLPNGTLNGSIPENRNDHEPDGRASQSNNQSDNKSTESSQTTIPGTDVTYASQLSLENPQGFSRDAFGRQSMSEKRHATLDAKSTDTYQKSKKMREMRGKDKDSNLVRVGSVESVISINRTSEHPEYADKLGQLGPSLGMKKSSSLESLQTMVQEIQMKEEGDPAYTYRGPSNGLKVIRGRGCEVSFRAAVDNNIDPNHPSEGGAKKHWLLDPPTDTERENDGFTNTRGGPRQSSLNAAQHSKNTKKKPGILKGIGSMFRFGKHRKTELPTVPVEPQYHTSNEFDNNTAPALPTSNQAAGTSGEAEPPAPSTDANHNERLQQEQIYQQVIHGPAQAPNMPKVPIQKSPSAHSLNPAAAHNPSSHHVQKSPQQNVNQQQQQRSYLHQHQHSNPQTQREMIQHREHREPIYQRHGYVHRHAEHVQVIPENSVAPPPKYRNNNDSQRRTDRKTHEQRMAMRHSYYPSDSEREPIYEQRQRQDSSSSNGNSFGRPGSRSGITESSVPFTHYVNYNDLQTHLRSKDPLSDNQIVQMRMQVQHQRLKVEEESRKQHQYHSQRQTRTDNQLRPVSNFYEYESVSSLLNTKMRPQNNMATPHMMPSVAQQNGPPPYQDANSNLTRQPQNSLQNSRRGPFVTHVTIGEHKQQQNGTKV